VIGSNNSRITVRKSNNMTIEHFNTTLLIENSSNTRVRSNNRRLDIFNSINSTIDHSNDTLLIDNASNTTVESNNIECAIYERNNTLGSNCMFVHFRKGLLLSYTKNVVTNSSFIEINGIGNVIDSTDNVFAGIFNNHAQPPSKNIISNSRYVTLTNGSSDNKVEHSSLVVVKGLDNTIQKSEDCNVIGYSNIVQFSNAVDIGNDENSTLPTHDNIVHSSRNVVLTNNNYNNKISNSKDITFADDWHDNTVNTTVNLLVRPTDIIGYLNIFNNCINVETSAIELIRCTMDNVQNTNLPSTQSAVGQKTIYSNVHTTFIFRNRQQNNVFMFTDLDLPIYTQLI
jgi:hypothetical protein